MPWQISELSGVELRRRLEQRGVPEDVVEEMVIHRERYWREIQEILDA